MLDAQRNLISIQEFWVSKAEIALRSMKMVKSHGPNDICIMIWMGIRGNRSRMAK